MRLKTKGESITRLTFSIVPSPNLNSIFQSKYWWRSDTLANGNWLMFVHSLYKQLRKWVLVIVVSGLLLAMSNNNDIMSFSRLPCLVWLVTTKKAAKKTFFAGVYIINVLHWFVFFFIRTLRGRPLIIWGRSGLNFCDWSFFYFLDSVLIFSALLIELIFSETGWSFFQCATIQLLHNEMPWKIRGPF